MGDDQAPVAPERRVTDAERTAVVDRLRAATVDGSLDLDELGERIDLVFKARTTGELVAVTADLPEPTPLPAVRSEAPDGSPMRRRAKVLWRDVSFRVHATTWGMTNGFLTGIWLLAGAGHFWPFYPAAGWGIGLGLHAMATLSGDDGDDEDPARGAGRRSDRRAEHAERDARRRAQREARDELRRAGQELAIDLQRNAARTVRQLGQGPWGAPGPHGNPGPHGARRRGGRYADRSDAGHGSGAGPSVDRVTVLVVDVVGSTRLNAAMGDAAWSAVRSRLRALVGTCLEQHGGAEFSTAGDGILARFDDEAAAARCAVATLGALTAQREATGFAPSVRIGIHSGAAVADGTDLVGQVVNLAARVSDAAEPDEILVTEAVAERIDDRLALEDRGLRALKGIEQPRHLLAVTTR